MQLVLLCLLQATVLEQLPLETRGIRITCTALHRQSKSQFTEPRCLALAINVEQLNIAYDFSSSENIQAVDCFVFYF